MKKTRNNARRYWPYMDWASDECTGPFHRSWYHFEKACHRHDFSWRNLKRIHRNFPRSPNVWTSWNKRAADNRLRRDLSARCGEIWWAPGCQRTADVFYIVVTAIPPYYFGRTTPTSFRW